MTAIKMHCTTCGRDAYVSGEETPVCPVCSGPLIEAVTSDEPTP
jgi:endogenous inhibitor of DNA gyrase (YacG/DUF329 family)